MSFNDKRFYRLLDIAEKHNMYIQVAEEYAEPGYSKDNEDGPIVFSGWNSNTKWNEETRQFDMIDDTPDRIGKILEKLGCTLEWEDEWQICNCGKAFRTSPDCYQWTEYGAYTGGEYLCGDCIKEDPTDYLEELEGNTSKCLTFDIDLEEHGYICLNWNEEGRIDSYERGFHNGQDDDPRSIAKCLQERNIQRFLFQLDESSQFYVCFSTWVHREELGLSEDAEWEEVYSALCKFRETPIESIGTSPSKNLKKCLQSVAPSVPGKVVVTHCNVDNGTTETEYLTPDEFVKGVGK